MLNFKDLFSVISDELLEMSEKIENMNFSKLNKDEKEKIITFIEIFSKNLLIFSTIWTWKEMWKLDLNEFLKITKQKPFEVSNFIEIYLFFNSIRKLIWWYESDHQKFIDWYFKEICNSMNIKFSFIEHDFNLDKTYWEILNYIFIDEEPYIEFWKYDTQMYKEMMKELTKEDEWIMNVSRKIFEIDFNFID